MRDRLFDYNKNDVQNLSDGLAQEEGLPRRVFLTRALKVAAGLAVTEALGDTFAGELLWSRPNPEIHLLDNPEAKRRYPASYTLAIGGFNVSDFKGLGEEVEAVIPERGQTAYLEYSDNGINMDSIERTALRFIEANSVRHLTLYGHSMGGMVATDLAARLNDKIQISVLILDCTPTGEADLRGDGQIGTWLLHEMDIYGVHLGPVARTLMETTSATINDKRHNPLSVCVKALHKAFSSKTSSNRLIQSEASLIRTFDPSKYRNVFSPAMPILRIRPEKYIDDAVVNNETSLPRWESGLGHVVIDVPVKNSGHADPGHCQSQYEKALTSSLKKCQPRLA